MNALQVRINRSRLPFTFFYTFYNFSKVGSELEAFAVSQTCTHSNFELWQTLLLSVSFFFL